MTAITVLNKDNVPIGPFTREQIEAKLKSSECTLNDLAFTEGLTAWTPLGQVLAKIGPPAIASSAAPVAGTPAYSYSSAMQPTGQLVYAGFWLRFVAYILDRMIVGIPLFILNFLMDLLLFPGQGFKTPDGEINYSYVELIFFQSIFGIVVYWLYFALQESSAAQATVGKRVLGLKVTTLDGQPIDFGRATGRFFGKIVSAIILMIGFMMAGFTERKQALHDMLAGTLVIKGQS